MKILKSIGMALVTILLCVSFTSCEKEPILTLSVQQITAPSSGNSTKVLVNANNPWTVSGNDWCTVSPSSGEGGEVSVTVTVKENTTYNDRNCTLTFTSEGLMASISVSQESNYGIVLPKDTYNVSSDAQQISVEVKANVEYDITINADWIKQSGTKALTSKTFTFDIEKNSTYDNREGIITIKEKNGNDIKTIKVKQVQVDAIIISSNEYSLSSKAQSLEVKLQTNVDLDIVIPDNAKTWVSHNSTKALSDKTVIFDIKENEDYSTRACEIILKKRNDTYADTIKIEQAHKDAIILSQKEYKLSSEKHTLEVKLQTNVDIEVNVPESAKSWISMVETKALVDKTIVFDIKENTDYSARNCDVIITQNNSSIADTIKIEQAHKDAIILSQKEYNLSCDAQNVEVKLQTNVDFDIHIPDAAKDWVSHMSTRALVDKTLVLEIKANEGYDARSCEVILKMKNNILADTIKIHQAQKDTLFLNVDAIEVKSKGETINCELNSNIEYICKINEGEDWIKRISTRGLTEFKETFEILSNQAFSPRTGSIIFRNNEKNIADTLFINQYQVDTVFVDTKDIRATWKGDEYEVTVCSNVQYDLKLPEWVIEKGKTTSNENDLLITTYLFEITENLDIDKDDNIIFIWNNEGTETETKIHIYQECCTIELKCAGTLKDELTSNQIAKIKYLVIKGDLNGTDALFFRRMTNLVHIDLEYANIVSGALVSGKKS